MDFSIIIPAKNEEINLHACFGSLAKLNYPPDKYEVLLIDNGSTDATVELAHTYDVKVFIKPELTISGLRNFGAKESAGKVLAFLDADCTVSPDWLNAAAKWIDHYDVSCFGGPPGIPEQATWVQKSWYLVRGKDTLVTEVDWLESMNMFIKKDLFLSVSGFDESLETCEDYDLSLRLKKHGRIVADKSIKAVHHGEAATVLHFYRKESWRGTSNLSGLLRHGIHLKELPSLLIPFGYILSLLLSLVLFVGSLIERENILLLFIFYLVCWQGAILALAYMKGKGKGSLSTILGLSLLLNVYFYARFRAMLRISRGKK
jgi:glycosyltransferase involved in cell wall biosynthesis